MGIDQLFDLKKALGLVDPFGALPQVTLISICAHDSTGAEMLQHCRIPERASSVKDALRRRIIARTFVALGIVTVVFHAAFADGTPDRVDATLRQIAANAQKMAQLVDQGCPGETNPIHQDLVLAMSADIGNKISDIRVAFAKGSDLIHKRSIRSLLNFRR